MYRIGRILAVLALGFGLAGRAHAGASLVANAIFDSPSGGGSFVSYADDATMGPWQVMASGVDLLGSYWHAPNGIGGCVDLNGNAPGGITEQRATMAGQLYQLSFDLSGSADDGPSTSRLGISVETSPTTAHYAIGSNTPSNTGDILEAFSFP